MFDRDIWLFGFKTIFSHTGFNYERIWKYSFQEPFIVYGLIK